MLSVKHCSRCNRDLPRDKFRIRRKINGTLDGLSCYCIECINKKKQEERAANPIPHRQEALVWYYASEENRQKSIKKATNWNINNKNNPLVRKRIRKSNSITTKRRRKESPEKFIEQDKRHSIRRSALKRGNYYFKFNETTYEKLLLIWQNNLCFYCSTDLRNQGKGRVHLEHVVPLTKNGFHCPGNLVIACHSCNSSKLDKIPWIEWWPRNCLIKKEELFAPPSLLS